MSGGSRRDQDDVFLSNRVLGHDFERAGAIGGPDALAAYGPAIPFAAAFFDQRSQFLPGEIAGGGDGDVWRDIPALEIGVHLVARQGGDTFLRAENGVS